MFSLSGDQLVVLASALFSGVLILGLCANWRMGRGMSGRRYTYLLYYAVYLAVVNIPKLLMSILGYTIPLLPGLMFDIAEVTLIFLAAESWTAEKTTWRRWLILAPAYVTALAGRITGDEIWLLLYGFSFGLVLLLTIYNISRNAPWYVTLGVAISFAAWIFMEATFFESGPPVGHAFGMLIKMMLLGSVMFATYERQHRELWEAAWIRKEAIEIIAAGQQKMVDPDFLNGKVDFNGLELLNHG